MPDPRLFSVNRVFCWRVATSQMMMDLSIPTEASSLPWSAKARSAVRPVWPERVAIRSPRAGSHNPMVPSPAAEANREWSGLNATV